jgi:exodeoxyribonuclease V gamma subunit
VLHLRFADRADALIGPLADVMSQPLADPFTPEWVAVPSVGMRRWLAQRLSHRLGASGRHDDGVSANLELPLPSALRRLVLTEDLPPGAADPWQIERLVWPVLGLLTDHARDPILASIATVPPGGTIMGRARRVTDLFDRYAIHRPGMIRHWAAGRDVDATGRALLAGLGWQPHLWRLVRAAVGSPSAPERLPGLLDRVASGTLDLDLPPRLSLFGMGALSADLIALTDAIAVRRAVHLFLLTPSPALTSTLFDTPAPSPLGIGGQAFPLDELPRSADSTADHARHPLLRSWGQPSREGTVLAAGLTRPDDRTVIIGPLTSQDPETSGGSPTTGAPTALAALQADLRHNRAPGGDHELVSDDTTIQIRGAAGATRQVEVLRDAITHLLGADATLTEGDIVVLCPQIEVFAPLVHAGFGPSAGTEEHTGPRAEQSPALRYHVTDRSLRSRNPYLAATASLLELVAGRFTASELVDLLALAPVRERFGFDEGALATMDGWIIDTGIRWGLDGAQRTPWDLPASFTANTWQAGIDRLLVGVALADDDLALGPGGIAPLSVEGDDVALVGRLAEGVSSVARLAQAATGAHPLTAWCGLLTAAADELFATSRGGEWQRRHFDHLLGQLVEWAGAEAARPLTLADLRRLLDEHLEGDPARARFGTGAITVCSLQPLRGVPFRVVCLLGFDTESFAVPSRDGDDLITAQPAIGDRDRRADTRQLLLEAVTAASDALVITHTDFDVETNQKVPDAVPLSELCESLAATLTDPQGVESLRHTHPRNSFDPREFDADEPWGFDGVALRGARALTARRGQTGMPQPLVDVPLPTHPLTTVGLADLQSFLKMPTKTFLDRRLEVRLPWIGDDVDDQLPVALEPLARSAAGRDLLRTSRSGRSPDDWLRIEAARGNLPPGTLGLKAGSELTTEVATLLAEAERLGVPLRAEDDHPVDLLLDDGCRLVGSVGSCASAAAALPHGPGPVRVDYERPTPAKTLALWLDLLCLTVSDPDSHWRAVGVGRLETGKTGAEVTILEPRGDTADERRARALNALTVVVSLYRQALTEPLPLFPKTSHALAHGDRSGAARCWAGMYGEADKTENRFAFGRLEFRQLLTLGVGDDRARAEDVAHTLWDAFDASGVLVDPGEPT